MVILIRIYAFYFGSPRRIKYNTFTALRRFTYLYGITAMYMAQDGVAVETELFLATFVVRMAFRKGLCSPFPGVWKGNASTNSADVAVPKLCSFPQARGGLPSASHRVHSVTRLYLRFAFMCVSVDPTSRGHIPCSYGSFVTLYLSLRGMYSLRVYIGYDTYKALRWS